MRIRAAFARQKHLVFCLTAALVCLTASMLKSEEGSELGADDGSASHESVSGKFASREAEIADAIKRNNLIFDDWPKPQLALVFSGEMDGYLEPCGCAGLDNQKGGLQRRHTILKRLADQGWPLVPIDMGGLVRRVGPQAEMKYRFGLQSLIELGYGAVGFGVRELQLSTESLVFAVANLDPEKNPLVSANVGLIDFESSFSKRYRVVEKAGKRIGVTSVLGKRHEPALRTASEIIWRDPEQALREVLPQLENENCDLLVLLAHAEPEEVRQLSQKFPQFQFMVTAGAPEPPEGLQAVEGTSAQLIETGHRGMYVMVLGIFDDRERPFRLQRVPLDHRFEDSDAMQKMLIAYQDELKVTGFNGLGITGVRHPTAGFVGSAACADCHTMAMEEFLKTPHSHATRTLVKLDPPRHFDPECLSCHATGWEPQEYFPYVSGFLSLEETPHLKANGCENCHGPGQGHVAAESGDTDADDIELERLRAAMQLKIVENEGNQHGQVFEGATVVNICIKCHDEANSPDFDFQEYWPQVEHYGKD